MARQSDIKQPDELKGPERVFQIDRDTVLIYTGLHANDLRPFVRMGAGVSAPGILLRHIENVILPENDPLNAGLEMAWIQATVENGGENIGYVGSKDRVSQIYSYTGMQDFNARSDESEKKPVAMHPYLPLRLLAGGKDRCTTTFFETGDVQVSVGGSKVLSSEKLKKASLHIDKEYDLLSSALSKRSRKCESGYSFMYLGQGRGLSLPMYWNFNGEGMLVNPMPDYHYRLFESVIDPARVSLCAASSVYSPGLMESLRRKNTEKKPLGIYSHNLDRLGVIKKIYNNAFVKVFDDGRVLPSAKETTYYVSRGGSHAAITCKMVPGAERQAQILFPIGGGKFSKSFEYIRGQHDLEIAVLRSKDDLGVKDAKLVLHLPGEVRDSWYQSQKLSEGCYPLLEGKEYTYTFAESAAGLIEEMIKGLHGTNFEEPIKEFIYALIGQSSETEILEKWIAKLKTLPVPEGPALYSNLFEIFRFIEDSPSFQENTDARIKKRYEKVRKKYSIDRLRNRHWLSLAEMPVCFSILFMGGKKSYIIALPAESEVVKFSMPPSSDRLEESAKPYRTLLKQQSRALDKASDPPGYRPCLDLMERLLEERLRIVEERKRFHVLLTQLSIGTAPQRKQRSFSANPVIEWFQRGTSFLAERIQPVLVRIREMRAAIWLVPVLLLLGGALFLGIKSAQSITGDGGSSDEIHAATLVNPGTLQDDAVVPGEEMVDPVSQEVYYYANAVAVANGFSPVNAQHNRDLRDPDLVFPGDMLKLPDGRLTHVHQGESLWQISTLHYKKDMARLRILERQFAARSADEKKKIV